MEELVKGLKAILVKIVMIFAFVACALPALAQQSSPQAGAAVGMLRVKPKKLNFKLNLSKTSAKTKEVLVTNVGTADLTVVFGQEMAPFKVACSCTKDTIAPKQSVAALIAFQPTAAGKYSATFDITSDAGKGPANVTLALHGDATGEQPPSSTAVKGSITANGNPVSNSTVNLYAAGDNQTNSDASLILSVSSDSNGRFAFRQVHCPTPESEIYVTASGGMAAGCGASDDKLALMAALGNCSDLPSGQDVAVNELSTAASVNALAPYVLNNRLPVVGSRSTNANLLANAFVEAERAEGSQTNAPLTDALAACAQCGGRASAACQTLMVCGNSDSIVSGACTEPSPQSDTLQAAFSAEGSPAVVPIASQPD
jgi:hypothetical protein